MNLNIFNTKVTISYAALLAAAIVVLIGLIFAFLSIPSFYFSCQAVWIIQGLWPIFTFVPTIGVIISFVWASYNNDRGRNARIQFFSGLSFIFALITYFGLLNIAEITPMCEQEWLNTFGYDHSGETQSSSSSAYSSLNNCIRAYNSICPNVEELDEVTPHVRNTCEAIFTECTKLAIGEVVND
jgi:hypothetical protein